MGEQEFVGPQAVGRALAGHFSQFSKQGPPNHWQWYGNRAAMVSSKQQEVLVRPFTEQEVLIAIKGLNNERAPGLDGFPVFFFREFWDVMKAEIFGTLDELCTRNHGLEHSNKSYLFLLPKCPGAVRVGKFLLISLFNSFYLIIAKVLANRLQEAINELVDPFQSVFILWWQSVDGGSHGQRYYYRMEKRNQGFFVEGRLCKGLRFY